MKKVTLLSFASILIIGISSYISKQESTLSVSDILFDLGDTKPLHYISSIDEKKVEIGKALYFEGSYDGSKRISKHYVCSNCHNTVREDPDLTKSNPETRLKYAAEKQIPFLQGTTMYGVVNRTTWYNDDYEKKYGDLVIASRDTLENAIQLCAEVCSQGRRLESWELEAFIHYFWTLQMNMDDLDLSSKEKEIINKKEEGAIDLIKSKFLSGSPATFIGPLPVENRKYGEGASVENGAIIFRQSCLECHSPEKDITNLKLEDNRLTKKLLKSKMRTNKDLSIYKIIRAGTHPIEGYKPYMPHYTKERLSDKQIEDLAAYIKSK